MPSVTGHFGPIPIRTQGRLGSIPICSGRFGPISGVGCFGRISAGCFGSIFNAVLIDTRIFSDFFIHSMEIFVDLF